MKSTVPALILVFCALSSQSQTRTFHKQYHYNLPMHGHEIVSFNDYSSIIGTMPQNIPFARGPYIKIDSAGNIVWAKEFHLPDSVLFSHIEKVSEHNILIYFNFDMYPYGRGVINLDTSGTIISVKRIINDTNQLNRIKLFKTDANLNLIWSKRYEMDSIPYGFEKMIETDDGGFLFVGSTPDHPSGAYNYFTVKLDSRGDLLHSSITHRPNLYYTALTKINSNMYLYSGGGRYACFDSIGYLVWSKVNSFNGVEDGILAKNHHLFFQGGACDIGCFFGFIEMDSVGTVINRIKYDHPDSINFSAINILPDGSLISVGGTYFNSCCIMDLLKADPNNLTGCYEEPFSLSYDSVVTDYTSPTTIRSYNDTVVFADYNGVTFTAVSIDDSTFCINVNGVSNLPPHDNFFRIFPNPFSSYSTIEVNSLMDNCEVVIDNLLGKEIMRKRMNGIRMRIEKENLEKGVYFIGIRNIEHQFFDKIVVE